MDRNKLVGILNVPLEDEPIEQREKSIRIGVDKKLIGLFETWRDLFKRKNEFSLDEIRERLNNAGVKDISPEEFVKKEFRINNPWFDAYDIVHFKEIKYVSGKITYYLRHYNRPRSQYSPTS